MIISQYSRFSLSHTLYFADQSVRPETEEVPFNTEWPLPEGNIEMIELFRDDETPFDATGLPVPSCEE